MQLAQLLSPQPQTSDMVLELKKTPAWEVVKAIAEGACTRTAIEITTGRSNVNHLLKAAGAVIMQTRVSPSLPGSSRFEYSIRPEFESQIRNLLEKRPPVAYAPKERPPSKTESYGQLDPDYAILRVPALLYRNRTFKSNQVNVALDVVKFISSKPATVVFIHRTIFGNFIEYNAANKKRLGKLLRELVRDGIVVRCSRGFQTHPHCVGIFDLAIKELKR